MKKVIVYYSYRGNTKSIAEMIQKSTGADIARVETVVPYDGDYNSVVNQGQDDWLCLFDLGGQAGGIGAAGGVSVWPWCWACCALLRHGAGLAALVPCLLSVSPAGPAGAVRAGAGHGRRSQANRLANRQNAQRFNKKCSIMTKIMPCILCFLRCKYACFGVK